MNLREIVDQEQFDGILVVPDIHDDIRIFVDVIGYAIEHNLFIMSLGDLSDGEERKNPQYVVEAMHTLLIEGRGAMVHGNHDSKYARFAMGNSVTLNDYQLETLKLTDGREQYFLDLHKEIHLHPHTDFYAYFDNIFFAHAAAHPAMFEHKVLNRAQRERLMHGMTNGKRDHRDYPVRLYDWCNEVPDGHHLFVGHDREPLGNWINGGQPFINKVGDGSAVYFMDTGCGKGGYMSTAVLLFEDDSLTFSKFQRF